MARGQAERLIPLIEEILAEAGVSWRNLTRIGVGTGPGNFTGIRISVSAARGLALGLEIPAIGVSAFEALAFEHPRPCIALVAAPRQQVYAQHFLPERADAPSLCSLDETPSKPPAPGTTYVGAQAETGAEALSGNVVSPRYPLAEAIARIAAAAPADSPAPAPLYVRAANAAPASEAPLVILDDA